jgi:sugar lactone lactonase YvrE
LPKPEGVVGFNDLCALPTGALLVGALRWSPFGAGGGDPTGSSAERNPTRVPGEFWHVVGGDEEPSVDFDDIEWANGCGADEARRRTYACDYARGRVWMRDPEGKRVFADVPGGEADGLAVDGEGGVWVATAQGGTVVRLSPDDGSVVDTVAVGGRGIVTSVAFDGGDGMIVTTATSVLRMPAPVPGPRHFLATV